MPRRLALLIVCALIAIACLFRVAYAGPSLAAAWKPGGLRVAWYGAEPGSCLYLDGVFVPVPCGASGSVLLPMRGVDVRSRPDPGDVLSLMRDETRGARVEATVPWHVARLPIVVH